MDAPPTTSGATGPQVGAHTKDGDIIVVSTTTCPPTIPAGKDRRCPQCGKAAWLLSRHCWHCGFDFGSRGCSTGKLLFLAAVFNLAAAIATALVFYAHQAQ